MSEYEQLVEQARRKGTDKQFRRWVSFQPSGISGRFSEWVDGIGRCEAAHVRRTWMGSGTGKKGDYCCVPLRSVEHRVQHQKGEAACLREFTGIHYTAEEAKMWFEAESIRCLKKWLSIE